MGDHDIIKFNQNLIKSVGDSLTITNKLLALKNNKINILVANDHPLYIRALIKTLENYTHINFIGEAYNFEDIFLKMPNLKPDILITDDQMPRTDFLNDIPKLKKLYPNLKIIVYSFGGYDSKISEYIQYVNGYLCSSADTENYLEAFTKVHEGDNYFMKFYFPKDELREEYITNNREQFLSIINDIDQKYANDTNI